MIPKSFLTEMESQTPSTCSNMDGQEDSISKETVSKDDQELRKSLQLFWEPLQIGRHPWPLELLCSEYYEIFLKAEISRGG
jgi:hypothetical protein